MIVLSVYHKFTKSPKNAVLMMMRVKAHYKSGRVISDVQSNGTNTGWGVGWSLDE